MKSITIFGLAILLVITGCASSTHHVSGVLRQPLPPEAVMVYRQMPTNAEVVGTVTANSYAGVTTDDANANALQQLRREAGRLGANGVVLVPTNEPPMDGAQMLAKAVYVSP